MIFNKADFIASYGISSQLPESDRPELSFSGRSNVGKSSLINKLCSRKNLARVSSTPGKTATINFYSVDDCYFVDLPGYGYAKVSNADPAGAVAGLPPRPQCRRSADAALPALPPHPLCGGADQGR